MLVGNLLRPLNYLVLTILTIHSRLFKTGKYFFVAFLRKVCEIVSD